VRCELEDGTLSVGTSGDDTDYSFSVSQSPRLPIIASPKMVHLEVHKRLEERTVSRVVDGDNDARGEDNLLPGLANVQNVDTVGPGLPQVRLHVHLEVLAAEMALRSQEHLNVLLGGVEDGGEVGRSHVDGSGLYKLVGIQRLSSCVRENWTTNFRDIRIVVGGTSRKQTSAITMSASAKPGAGDGSAKDSRVVAASECVASNAATDTSVVVPAGADMYVQAILPTLLMLTRSQLYPSPVNSAYPSEPSPPRRTSTPSRLNVRRSASQTIPT
jgi:hypothetical protein